MLITITTEPGHKCKGGDRYFPGDVVRGSVRLYTSSPLDTDNISVTLLGEQESKVVANGVESGWINAELLKTTAELHRRDRYAGAPPLAAGTYVWPFVLAFPELPEDWTTQKLQSRYPGSFFYVDAGHKSLVFTRYVIVVNVKGSGIDEKKVEHLAFWPTRRTRLENGPIPTVHNKVLHFSFPLPHSNKLKKFVPGLTKYEDVTLAARIYVPKLHIIGTHVPLQLELQFRRGQDHPGLDKTQTAQVTVARVHLMATTKVGQKEPMVVTTVSTIEERVFQNLAITVPLSNEGDDGEARLQRINLHDSLPHPGFLIESEPFRNMDPDLMKNGHGNTPGPIVPTFEAPLCSRTYHLRVSLRITLSGQNKIVELKSDEIVLLPDELDQSLPRKTATAQLDHTGEVGRYEAPQGQVLEAEGDHKRAAEVSGTSRPPELDNTQATLQAPSDGPRFELPAVSN